MHPPISVVSAVIDWTKRWSRYAHRMAVRLHASKVPEVLSMWESDCIWRSKRWPATKQTIRLMLNVGYFVSRLQFLLKSILYMIRKHIVVYTHEMIIAHFHMCKWMKMFLDNWLQWLLTNKFTTNVDRSTGRYRRSIDTVSIATECCEQRCSYEYMKSFCCDTTAS